jgi:prepilin-type processing-associated H-X9-DG protein
MARQFRVQDLIVLVAVVALGLMVIVNILAVPGHGSSHRVHCSSNLRQVGLALIQYANTYQKVPPSQLSQTGTSGLIFALPFLEEQATYNAYNLSLPRWAPENAQTVGMSIPVFNCPDPYARDHIPDETMTRLDGTHDPGRPVYAKGNYAVNWGGGRGGWGQDFETTVGRNRGVMRAVSNFKMDGPLPLIGLLDLRDGASMTLLVTEKRDSQGWAVGGWAGSEFDVGTSPAMNTGDKWGDRVYSGSYHPGEGANMVMCDGSAKFFFSKMDRKIWYATITRAGGEFIDNSDGMFGP